MADAQAAVNTPAKQTKFDQNDELTMATSATIYQGTGVAVGSDGKLVHASQASALYTIGVAQETKATAAAGATIKTRQGIFRFANDAGHLLSIANRLGPCYWSDDQTVGTDSSKLLAGVVYDVDANGVWVIMGPCLVSAASVGALLAANNLNDVLSASSARHNIGLGSADSPTFTGLTLTGALAGVTGALTGNFTSLHPVATKTTTYPIVNAVDGDTLFQSLTDGQVFTLPASVAANKGQIVKVQNIGANAAALITVNPTAGDYIQGAVMAVYAGGVVSKGWNNTKATAKKGDYSILQSDGAGTWWLVGGMGVWASTP